MPAACRGTSDFTGRKMVLPWLPCHGFLPQIWPDFDDRVIQRYHLSMDERIVDNHASGASQTGRRLLFERPHPGAEILAAGASDWIVYPRCRSYPDREGVFLHHIVHTVDKELRRDPEIDAKRFRAWIDERQAR
jgi:hypothetical protein